MCRTALGRSSSSRHKWLPGVITSRAVARPASKLSCARPLQTMSRSVTIPDETVVLSDRNSADIVLAHQFSQFGDRSIRANPVDALVHRVFDFHGGPR